MAEPYRFDARNKMDPGEQPKVFKSLTLVKKMLIAQVRYKNKLFKCFVLNKKLFYLNNPYYRNVEIYHNAL